MDLWLYLQIVLVIPLMVSGGGVFEMKFVQYDNNDGKDAAGQCCESILTFFCSLNECDPIFDICLLDSPGTGCMLGQMNTGYVKNTDHITFGTVIGSRNVPNPIIFPFTAWTGMVIMKVTVYDEDQILEGKGDNDKIDYIQQIYTTNPDPNNKRINIFNQTLTGSLVKLTVELNTRCDKDFYGNDCMVQCHSISGKYDCDSAGNKVCHPGWEGANCDINKNECTSHLCVNGATCVDHLNGYTCSCPPHFSGYNCELPVTSTILTSTLPTSTKVALTSLDDNTQSKILNPLRSSFTRPAIAISTDTQIRTTPIISHQECNLDVISTNTGTVMLQVDGQFNNHTFETFILDALIEELENNKSELFLNVTQVTNATSAMSIVYLYGFDIRRSRVIHTQLLANISETYCVLPIATQYAGAKQTRLKATSDSGPLIGGVIGVLVGLGTLSAVVVFLVKRYNSRSAKVSDTDSDSQQSEETAAKSSPGFDVNNQNIPKLPDLMPTRVDVSAALEQPPQT